MSAKAALMASVLLLVTTTAGADPVKNGFDLAGALVPADEIKRGGPPRDGIPAVDAPKFIAPAHADDLKNSDRVLGIRWGGIARAYPVSILNWHEIVNDQFAGEPVAITYCPLCGSGVAYRAKAGDRPLTFGVSGLLYNSEVLLYDRQTESLWSQILARAVSGPQKGQHLQMIPVSHTSWGDWKARNPETTVISTDTGHRRDYSRDPYGDYDKSPALYFSVAARDGRFHPKEMVIGLEVAGQFKAYPFSELARTAGEIADSVGGRDVVVSFDAENRSASVRSSEGELLPAITAYWFAWYAFHPDTAVFRANGDGR